MISTLSCIFTPWLGATLSKEIYHLAGFLWTRSSAYIRFCIFIALSKPSSPHEIRSCCYDPGIAGPAIRLKQHDINAPFVSIPHHGSCDGSKMQSCNVSFYDTCIMCHEKRMGEKIARVRFLHSVSGQRSAGWWGELFMRKELSTLTSRNCLNISSILSIFLFFARTNSCSGSIRISAIQRLQTEYAVFKLSCSLEV